MEKDVESTIDSLIESHKNTEEIQSVLRGMGKNDEDIKVITEEYNKKSAVISKSLTSEKNKSHLVQLIVLAVVILVGGFVYFWFDTITGINNLSSSDPSVDKYFKQLPDGITGMRKCRLYDIVGEWQLTDTSPYIGITAVVAFYKDGKARSMVIYQPRKMTLTDDLQNSLENELRNAFNKAPMDNYTFNDSLISLPNVGTQNNTLLCLIARRNTNFQDLYVEKGQMVNVVFDPEKVFAVMVYKSVDL